jgi:hypothetical protein
MVSRHSNCDILICAKDFLVAEAVDSHTLGFGATRPAGQGHAGGISISEKVINGNP